MMRRLTPMLGLVTVLLAGCAPATPADPSTPATSTSPTESGAGTIGTGTPTVESPSGAPSPDDVAESAMLLASDLPGGARLTRSDPGLPPPRPDGIPGEPFCNPYDDGVVAGFTERTAMRANAYAADGGEIAQRVERYAEPAAAARVFDELQAMVVDCGIWEHTVSGHVTPLQAGEKSWRFTARGYHDAEQDWLVVQQGDLLSIVVSALPLDDLSPVIVQRLCTDTSHC
jgi:hypothetical protein